MKDISPLFKYNELNTASIEFFIKIFENCQGCSLTNDVFRGRSNLFKLLTGHEDLSLRRLVFVLLARICRTNSSIMIFSSTNTLNFDDFLMAERLAFIELRLQLDLPPNYLELDQNERTKERIEHGETPKVSFTQEIGSLINPELSAASCELLEFLMVPLLDNEENFSDEDIDKYFKNINSILEECVAIFKAAKGKRDCQRNELKCLLSIFAKWLIEAPFLCGNKALIREIKSLVRLLWWFPREALLFIPALQELANGNAKQDMKLGINELGKKLNEFASDEEKIEIQKLIETVYK
ncbi:hypothetical protein GPJ56_007608 [Histomonas meleagridis]|uniref:uncharacterized protein n=1 Tax=Histomonas meleagridis TaxID=135588 RepID=UPI0035594808|nr:hypothetical protein GPJ56_007608 [Histomonas meleagridis]KAH0806128.1 hypothetical protein GO595_001141 [Histomonas meleagridis]